MSKFWKVFALFRAQLFKYPPKIAQINNGQDNLTYICTNKQIKYEFTAKLDMGLACSITASSWSNFKAVKNRNVYDVEVGTHLEKEESHNKTIFTNNKEIQYINMVIYKT